MIGPSYIFPRDGTEFYNTPLDEFPKKYPLVVLGLLVFVLMTTYVLFGEESSAATKYLFIGALVLIVAGFHTPTYRKCK